MRKYFLLGAVAMLAASNASAENTTYTLEAQAKVALSSKVNCTTWDWGTIYLNDLEIDNIELQAYGAEITPSGTDVDKFSDIIGYKSAVCEGISYEGSVYLPDFFVINDGGIGMRIENITIDEEYVLSGTLVLDSGGVPYDTSRTYTGSVTFTVIN
ncbi:MAG: hypothetical protein IJ019_00515 [Alphaproteobacteria bacterium]|nr:hypothetical protein [Alphaproteobacteria bacterium]